MFDFDVQSGCLRYHPFSHFQLPEIIQATRVELGTKYNPFRRPEDGPSGWDVKEVPLKAEFRDKKGEPKFTRGLYRLKWAGESTNPKDRWDEIPYKVIQQLAANRQLEDLKGKKATKETFEQLFDLYTKGTIQMDQLLEMLGLPNEMVQVLERQYKQQIQENTVTEKTNLWTNVGANLDKLPKILPDSLAYHLAVNADHYFKTGIDISDRYPHPVGGLNSERLGQILTARFALDDQAIAALNYLRWMAEGHYRHPLLTGFDTMVRERLMDLSTTCTQMYFWMLQDYLYDSDNHYWVKAEWKQHWHQLTGYMFWLGRTGAAIVTDHAGIEPLWASNLESFKKHCPDVMQGITEWDKKYNWGRNLIQVDPKAESSTRYVANDPELPKCWGHLWKATSTDCAACLQTVSCKKENVKRSQNLERVIKKLDNPIGKRTVLRDPTGTVLHDSQLGDIRILKRLSKPESSTLMGDPEDAIPFKCTKEGDGEGGVQACSTCPRQARCSDRKVVRELPKGKDKASLCLRIAIKMNIPGSDIQSLMDLPDSQLEAIDKMAVITNNPDLSAEEWEAINKALVEAEDKDEDEDGGSES